MLKDVWAHLQSLWGGLLIYRIDCSFNFFEIASAHFVGKFTYINIVDFFITRSITSNKFVLSSLNQEIHILAIFNLVQLSYILSIAQLFGTFCATESTKELGSRVRHSVFPLFTNCISISCCNILQSVHTSPLAACRNAWGGKNSLRSNIMPPVSKHCSATRCASQRCPFAFSDELLLQ